ncbi:spermidine synthase [Fretibacter rubidus]|uniref:spermidine synthase n=1 Tax=Fretibacter rubidus TaxID=570162 RepID=UPI00352AC359
MTDISVTLGSKDRQKQSALAMISVFTLAILLSAVLLFSVQPMFTKLVLPLLGGSSNVWNTAMVFFQAVLLLGYIYAHVITKYLPLKAQIIIHMAVLGLGCFFLPLSIAQGWTPPDGGAQSLWLIGLFGISVGAPFFAISANAPLLQRWFSRVDHKDAQDPYFLYAASNAGSLLSLLLYPIVFEPALRVGEQTALWAVGYGLLMVIIVGAGITAFRNQATVTSQTTEQETSRGVVTINRRLFWIFLAFIPSSLMLGVTSHMTNNIASTPFLWVMPLALYLLTFVIAFAKNPPIGSKHLGYVAAFAIMASLFFGFYYKANVLLSIGVSLSAYFIISLACHSRLVEDRPNTSHLTEFYIWMSVGGVLGGMFNALLAPVVFNGIYEYLIVLILSYLVVLRVSKIESVSFSLKGKLLALTLGTAVIALVLTVIGQPAKVAIIAAGCAFFFGLRMLTQASPRVLVMDISLVFGLALLLPGLALPKLFQDRSFFSLLTVKAEASEYGTVHKFIHGDTVHNYQLQDDGLSTVPLAYYAADNSFDIGMQFARSLTPQGDLSVAMIGLGAGAMACYERPTDNWTYYEIDQAVVDMARNPKYFSYIQDCSYGSDIVTGDARLKIGDLAPKSQDYIVVDAFSSNSIPAHLVTREAFALYRSRLKDTGVVFFHTSNRMLDVDSLVIRLAEDAGLSARHFFKNDFDGEPYQDFQSTSSAVMIGTEAQMSALSNFDARWTVMTPSEDVALWSDDYSNVVATMRAKSRLKAEKAAREAAVTATQK